MLCAVIFVWGVGSVSKYTTIKWVLLLKREELHPQKERSDVATKGSRYSSKCICSYLWTRKESVKSFPLFLNGVHDAPPKKVSIAIYWAQIFYMQVQRKKNFRNKNASIFNINQILTSMNFLLSNNCNLASWYLFKFLQK